MQPSSRGSSRITNSNFRPPSSYQDDIFNNSFYEEKIGSGENYHSSEFMKRYASETNLCFTVEKVVGTVLGQEKLPANPFNLMYRIIHHQTIFENLKRHYTQDRQYQNLINYRIQQDEPHQADEELLTSVRIRDKEVFLSQRLAPYLNMTNLLLFYRIVWSKRTVDHHAALLKKYEFQSIELSFGGPAILDLRGNAGNLEIPIKLPKQQAERSLYCSESMLNITLFMRSQEEMSKCLENFVNTILEDVRESLQYKDENYTIYLQKLQLFNLDGLINLLEFSREQLLTSTLLVQKEMTKSLLRQNLIIRSKMVYRLSRDFALVLGEQFVTVYKQYVLIAHHEGHIEMLSNQSLKYALQQVFLSPTTVDNLLQQELYQDKDIFLEYKSEMICWIMHELKNQNIGYLMWQVFYYVLYENYESKENRQYVDQLNRNISYILLSPLAFVQELIFRFRCVRWLTLPSFPTQSEDQTYRIIIAIQREITAYIHRGNYIYWQLEVFYEAIKKLLSIIVEFKNLSKNSILFIIDHAQLILTGVTTHFNQILLVLQSNIISYITLMRQNLIEKEENTDVVSYDVFLKSKELPSRVLRLNDEIKKLKKQLNLPESEVKVAIIGKYVKKYKLYQKIYQFYWDIAIGKKMLYPLSAFLKLLMVNSTQCNFQYAIDNYSKPTFKIEVNQINEINIFEISGPETSYPFYSLNPDNLQVYPLKEYKTVLDLIRPILQQDQDNSADLGFRYGTRNTLQTASLRGTRSIQNGKTRSIISIKSIDLGDSTSEEITSFNQSKLLVDVAFPRNFSSKSQLHTHILEYLNGIMDRLDRENFSVLGLFSYFQNNHQVLNTDDYVYSKLLNEDNCLRFDYKKKLNLEKFIKFIDYNISQTKFMQLRVIYNLRDVIKVMKISFNFYYRPPQGNTFLSLFKANYILQRIFSSKKDLLSWCEVNQFKVIKQSQMKTNRSNQMISLKKLTEEKQISIIQILSQKELEQNSTQTVKAVSKIKYYRQSPFYNIIQRSLELLENLQILIEYLKIDRRGRYEMSHIRKIYDILKYYLIDRCLLKDDYIFSQGVSVSIINLMTCIREYIDTHPDNNGEQRELLYLQRIIGKLSNLVKYAEISCSVCIHESLNLRDPSS